MNWKKQTKKKRIFCFENRCWNLALPFILITISIPAFQEMSSSPGEEGLTCSTSFLWFGPRFLMKQELTSVIWLAVNFLWLFSLFPSITVLGNGAGFDTHQCVKVRHREREMRMRVPENSLTYDSTDKLRKRLGFGNSGPVSGSESSHLCSVNAPDTQPTARFHVTDR